MNKITAIRIVGAIPLLIGAYLLINGIGLLFQRIGEFTFQREGMNRILLSIPFLVIGVLLLLISVVLKRKNE